MIWCCLHFPKQPDWSVKHSEFSLIRLRHTEQQLFVPDISGSEPLMVKFVVRGTSIFHGPEVDRFTLNIFGKVTLCNLIGICKKSIRVVYLFTDVFKSVYLSGDTNNYHFKLWSLLTVAAGLNKNWMKDSSSVNCIVYSLTLVYIPWHSYQYIGFDPVFIQSVVLTLVTRRLVILLVVPWLQSC